MDVFEALAAHIAQHFPQWAGFGLAGGVLSALGPQIQWLQSDVTGDKVYCVDIAPNEKAVREHAERGGFPANRVSAVASIIDPTTAE